MVVVDPPAEPEGTPFMAKTAKHISEEQQEEATQEAKAREYEEEKCDHDWRH